VRRSWKRRRSGKFSKTLSGESYRKMARYSFPMFHVSPA
jgi:hypothetical protein